MDFLSPLKEIDWNTLVASLVDTDWNAVLTRVLEVSYDHTENIHWDMLLYGFAGAIVGVVLYEIICLIAHKQSIPVLRRVMFIGFLAWWAYIVIDITILQRSITEQGLSLTLFAKDEWFVGGSIDKYRLLHVVLNMALFVPAGFLLSGIMPRGHWFIVATVICLLASVGVETTQYLTHLGISDVEDVAANTIGGFLGYAVGWLLLFGKQHYVAKPSKEAEQK